MDTQSPNLAEMLSAKCDRKATKLTHLILICSSTHIRYNQTRVGAGQQGTIVHW